MSEWKRGFPSELGIYIVRLKRDRERNRDSRAEEILRAMRAFEADGELHWSWHTDEARLQQFNADIIAGWRKPKRGELDDGPEAFNQRRFVLESGRSDSRPQQVAEFHQAFGAPVLGRPTIPDSDRVRLRLRLVAEEFAEFCSAIGYPIDLPDFEASWNGRVDMVATADALADLDYVIEGTRLEFGIHGKPIADEVHEANMRKLGPDGKPLLDANGKVHKPDGWTPPDIAGVLRAQGWEP